MPILFQVTVPQWLSLPVETREKLRAQFKIPRTGQRSFVQVGGKGEVTSDGTTNGDLAALSLPAMAKYLGLVEVPGEEMLLTLFKKVVERVEETPLVEVPQANLSPEQIVPGETVAVTVDLGNGQVGTMQVHEDNNGQLVGDASTFVPSVAEKPLDRMSKQELLAKAKSLELDVLEEMTKAQIVEAIKGLTNANQQP